MQPTKRIVVNTLAQYIRTIINLLLTLYSSRLVLDLLGVEDYGIYALVAGVVGMLSFLTNSLVGSTQRFLSVNQGKGDMSILKKVFNNSLLLHIFLGVIIAIVLSILTPFLFNGFLKIPADRIVAAKFLYLQVVWMIYISFVTSPFRALIISRENIIYISIIDVIDGILKVLLVLALYLITSDKLISYGWVLLFIQSFNLISLSLYSFWKYEECSFPKIKQLDFEYLKDLFSYTGWVVYSSGAIALRTQGFSVVLNRFFGAVMNAAYGIGGQIAGMIAFLSTSFSNAIAPQLMAAEGGGNRDRMWKLAEVQSKFSFLLLSLLAIPTMFELQSLLEIWLVDVPQYASLWGCMFILMQTIDQLSSGLGLANRAMGKIGRYTLVTVTPKLLILPIGVLFFHLDFSLVTIFILFVLVETLCMYLRIHLLIGKTGFSAAEFLKNVIMKSLIPFIVSSLVCFLICNSFEFEYRFISTYFISIIVFCFSSYYFVLDNSEKQLIIRLLNKIKH